MPRHEEQEEAPLLVSHCWHRQRWNVDFIGHTPCLSAKTIATTKTKWQMAESSSWRSGGRGSLRSVAPTETGFIVLLIGGKLLFWGQCQRIQIFMILPLCVCERARLCLRAKSNVVSLRQS